jgi:hypothetical protein
VHEENSRISPSRESRISPSREFRISPSREQEETLGLVLAECKKKTLGSVLAESLGSVLAESLGSVLAESKKKAFSDQSLPRERNKESQGVGFYPQVLQVSTFSKGDKARVSLDMEFPLFKQASDKGIGG